MGAHRPRSLAALLVWGYAAWPGVFLGAYLVNATTYGPWYTSLGIATGNTLEVVLAAYLVTRFAGGRHAFERPLDVFKFAGLAGGATTFLTAAQDVTAWKQADAEMVKQQEAIRVLSWCST